MIRNIVVGMLVMVVLLPVGAGAGSKAESGLVGGAIGGALVGQAVGRDTEATLIGTAVGGMLGYMLGSEQDMGGRIQVRHASSSGHRDRYRRPGRDCQQSDILAEVNGRPQWISATVCRQDDEWVLADDRFASHHTVIIDRRRGGARPGHYWEDRPRQHRPRHFDNRCFCCPGGRHHGRHHSMRTGPRHRSWRAPGIGFNMVFR